MPSMKGERLEWGFKSSSNPKGAVGLDRLKFDQLVRNKLVIWDNQVRGSLSASDATRGIVVRAGGWIVPSAIVSTIFG